jgi:hypothetical protein
MQGFVYQVAMASQSVDQAAGNLMFSLGLLLAQVLGMMLRVPAAFSLFDLLPPLLALLLSL